MSEAARKAREWRKNSPFYKLYIKELGSKRKKSAEYKSYMNSWKSRKIRSDSGYWDRLDKWREENKQILKHKAKMEYWIKKEIKRGILNGNKNFGSVVILHDSGHRVSNVMGLA